MATRPLGLIVWLGVLAFSSEMLAAQGFTVSLDVRSASWVEKAQFDKAEFIKQCSTAGVRVAAPTDGVALIEYQEFMGPGYSLFGVYTGQPTVFGTNIVYKLFLFSPKDGQTLLVIETQAGTPYSNVSGGLHAAAIREFKATPQFRFSCSMIAMALGSRSEALKLLPWAMFDKEPRQLLEKSGFMPISPKERAFLSIARREFSSLEELGVNAAEPLVLFIEGFLPRSGFRWKRSLSRYGEGGSDALAAAVQALAGTGYKDSSKLLNELLRGFRSWEDVSAGENKKVVLASLLALSKIGDAFALSDLDSWSKKGGEVGPAATEAAVSIRSRLVRTR